jgi:molecular chaperone GrpE
MKKKENKEEEIIFEEVASDAVDVDFVKKIKKVKEELKKCQNEKGEYLDGWQRAKADLINSKKRGEEEKKNFARYANENLIHDLLPTLDNFEAALKMSPASHKATHLRQGSGGQAQDEIDISKWKTGFEHIYGQLKKTLGDVGLEEVNPLNEKFDPNVHESVEIKETGNKKEDSKIFEVVMKGYKLGDKIIRAPQVKVFILK